MAKEKKGTVKLLSSEFPPAEIQKATERAKDAILERRKLLDQLKDFASDNANLINLVKTLPNELHHEVMVPFGKAAFFPGRLIHTNELMVLLGEGYYAERTSKQTVDILKRREKALDSQVESLKSEIQDLKAEASVFEATADEAAAGVVQIMEEYDDEPSSLEASEEGDSNPAFLRSVKTEKTGTALTEEEFKRISDRMAELEKEEEEAEVANNDEEANKDEDDLARNKIQFSLNQHVRKSGVEHSNPQPVHEIFPKTEGSLLGVESGSSKKSPEFPGFKESSPVMVADEVHVPRSEPGSRNKAFTGSIVEHTDNLDQKGQTVAQNSKPVSRFKLRNKK